jgi:concanavalin A-like lectin/glucanase superfamily protein
MGIMNSKNCIRKHVQIAFISVCACNSSPINAADYALQFGLPPLVNHYVVIPDSVSLRPTEITIEMWVKPASYDGNGTLISKPNPLGSGPDYILYYRPGGAALSWRAANRSQQVGAPVTPLNTWTHVAVTCDSNFQTIMINGEIISQVAGGSITYGTWPVYIASGISTGGQTPPIDGLLDEIRIWDHSRSPAIIQSLMHSKLTGNEPGLMAYWSLDEGQGQIANDLSPNANHGTLGLNVGIDANDPVWVLSDALPELVLDTDLNNDGWTDGSDLGLMLGLWGAVEPVLPVDFNNDGIVDGADLGLLLGQWGPVTVP